MPMFGEDRENLRCSFCGKRREQVANLIAGPGVYICVDCVDLCNEIIGRADDPETSRGRRIAAFAAQTQRNRAGSRFLRYRPRARQKEASRLRFTTITNASRCKKSAGAMMSNSKKATFF